MDLGYYNSYMLVDTQKICANFKKVKAYVGDGIGVIPVVKGNAYGLGTVDVSRLLIEKCGATIIANAQVYESMKIRDAGYKDVELFVMGAAPFHAIPTAVENDIQLAVFNAESVECIRDSAKKLGKTAMVQVKIETGLNRIGAKPGAQLDAVLDAIEAAGNIEIKGIFTHYSTATEFESEFTRQQYGEFVKGYEQMKARGIRPQYVHTCNTGATIWLKEGYGTHSRNGSLYLGYSAMDDYANPLGVEEAASWRAFITNIHEVVPGESVGYSRFFKPDKPTVVATISIGYGDGFYRPMALNQGPVYVNETKTRYLGICMDQTFVDVTGIDCKLGDEVTIFGYTKGGALLSVFELERFTGQSFVYPLCSPNERVKRVYL